MSPNKGPCVVFVEELAEKRSVAYSSLQPMRDSKWAPPYRFKRSRGNAAATAYDLCRQVSLRHHPFDDKKPTTYKKPQKFADIEVDLLNCKKAFNSHCRNVGEFYDFDSYTDLSHFQPYSLDLVAMPLNTYYNRPNNHNHNNSSGGNAGGGAGGANNGNSTLNHNQNQKLQRHSSPTQQQQKNARNAQQAPKSENQIQLLKRDAEEEKEFQVMTPTPVPQQAHVSEQRVEPSGIPVSQIPVHYGSNGGFVQYYYPTAAECVDPHYYNVPGEMMASQPMYPVPAQAYAAAAPIPMQAAAPYAIAPSVPANQIYSMPMAAGWPTPGNPTSKLISIMI